MKKRLRKVMAFLLASVMLLGSMSLTAFADTPEFTAFLMFSDRNWMYGNWDATLESATTKVTGAGTYTVVLNTADMPAEAVTEDGAAGAQVFCVDVLGLGGDAYTATDVKVVADGAEVEMDASKIVCGDIEENGNFRIEIFNEYGKTVEDPAFDPTAFTFKDTLEVTFTLVEAEGSSTEVSDEAYTGFLMFSDRNWMYGNWDATLESATTTVTGAGTYTVVLNTADMAADTVTADGAAGAQVFCVDILGMGGTKYTATDVQVVADGAAVDMDATKVVCGDIEENGNLRIEIFNEYGKTVEDPAFDPTAFTFKDTLEVTFTLVEAEGSSTEAADSATAFLMFTDLNWAFGNWDAALESATTTVTGDGSYSVVLNASEFDAAGAVATGANVFCVDVLNLAKMCDIANIEVSDVKVLADGKEVEFDSSKMLCGDIEENGNFRIELFNMYGLTVEDPGLDYEGLEWSESLEVQFTLSGIEFGTTTEAPTEEETTTEAPVATNEFDANGKYNAYICIQSANYSFRNAFNDATYGKDSEVFNQITGWDGNTPIVMPGTLNDVVIEGNGKYEVSITGLDLTGEKAGASETLNLLFVSTDIPLSSGVTISNIEIKMGGKSVYEFEEAFFDPDEKEFIKPLFINMWNKELSADHEFAYELKAGMDIVVTFEVDGFAYDNASAEAPTEETTTKAPVKEEQTTAPASTEPTEDGGFPTALVVGIVAGIVVVAAVVVVVLKKKKA